MAKKQKSNVKGPGFHYSDENDKLIDELMQQVDDRPFYPSYVYELACLSCAFALLKDLKPEEFLPKSKTHKINAEQLSNSDVDFLFKAIAYYYTKDYRVLDNVALYRNVCEKYSNVGINKLYNNLKDEEFPNTALIRLINRDLNRDEQD